MLILILYKMTHITSNKLFDQLPVEDLIAVQIYLDDFGTELYDKSKMCVAPLTMTLVYKIRINCKCHTMT